jgi:hypothetical protein
VDVSSNNLDFIEIIEIDGRLSTDTNPGVRCRLRIRFDRSNRTPPTAQIYGTRSTYDGLYVLFHLARPYLTFKSRRPGTLGSTVYSDQVVPEKLARPARTRGVGGHEIGSLCFDRLTVRRRFDRTGGNKTRQLCLLLQGPSSAWGVLSTQFSYVSGRIKVRHSNTTVRLGGRLPFSIRVSPHFFNTDGEDPAIKLRLRAFAIYFTTKIPASSLKDDEFLRQALDVADKLLTIVSFLSKDWIAWYMYYFARSDSLLTEVSRLTYRAPHGVDFDELVVNPTDLRRFVRVAFLYLVKPNNQNRDVVLPMRLYVSSFETPFLEGQFMTAFRALEALVAMVTSSSSNRKLLPPSQFKNLRKKIEREIDASIEPDIAKRIKERLPQLNIERPSLDRRLDLMCEILGISLIDGLYPKGKEPTLVITRNQLVHRAHVDDIEFISREIVRIRAVVERALLKLVGWENVSRAPARFVSQRLESIL